MADSPVPGLAITARFVNEPDATIICVHGGLDRGGSFARLARRAGAFDVIAYDRRGYQGSRDLGPVSVQRHIDDLIAIAREASWRGPVILLGHSFGGVITLGAADREPQLASLVVNYESPMPWVLARPDRRPEPTGEPRIEAENFFRRMVSDSAWERLSESERESRRLDGAALLSDLSMIRQAPPFELATISTPMVYAHGDGPFVSYYRSLCHEMARINPAITCRELTNAGHGAHLACPDQLAALIRDIWDRQCASA
jgi:pimeloyl-ACP methyl ester carboxylesterase